MGIKHQFIYLLTYLKKWQMLVLCSRNTRLRIQCQDYTKHNTETNTMAARGCETYTCATENTELGILWTGKQINCKT